MKLCEIQYIDDRIEEILRNLRKKNSYCSNAAKNEGELFARVKNIINNQSGIFISEQEKRRICELMEEEEHVSPIMQRELYCQGYLDCLRLVLSLGK